ncbi:hypothetical protein HD806DRAFT_501296 [Xylariaceae sp. AK1471]|nr:hypothetical protein HD806DRAFT_501296 [Xylariaceae sp. AK1471]
MCTDSRFYLSLPLFHSAGLCSCLLGCLYAGFMAALSSFLASSGLVHGIHVYRNLQHSVLIRSR